MKYVTVAEMIAIEKEANAKGLTYDQMMENAGHGLAEAIIGKYGYLEESHTLGLVGSGNNGGDTLVALTYLAQEGWKTSAYIVGQRPPDDPLINQLTQVGGNILWLEEDPSKQRLAELLSASDILMDGILGTGIRLPLRGELADLLVFVRDTLLSLDNPPNVVAVDCPSGVDCDSGEAAEECIPANFTVTMAAIKQGLFKFPAYQLVGDLQAVGIGLPDEGEAIEAWRKIQCFVPDAAWVGQALPPRPLDAHKGTFGTALVIAGSMNYTGAALLAGEAAYRVGAGLVTLAVPTPLHIALAGQIPEVTWLLLPHEIGVIAESAADLVKDNLERVTSLLVGPGLGLEDTTFGFLSRLLTEPPHTGNIRIGFIQDTGAKSKKEQVAQIPPLIIDADALKLLPRIEDWSAQLTAPAILTPHPGEMSVLTGLPVDEIQADRLGIARKYSQEWGHVVVLKGAFTVIASPDGRAAVIPVATSALARAGSGDVLAGLIAGLCAQKVAPFPAAVAGAWIHAYAGLYAADMIGNTASVLAGDVLSAAINIISELN